MSLFKTIFICGGLMTVISSAFAGVSKYVTLTGKVWSFDSSTVQLLDHQNKIWKIPTRVLKKGFDLKPDQLISVTVDKADLKFVRTAHPE